MPRLGHAHASTLRGPHNAIEVYAQEGLDFAALERTLRAAGLAFPGLADKLREEGPTSWAPPCAPQRPPPPSTG